MKPVIGLAGWRLPTALEDGPLLAARVGAQRMQVDYGGHDRAYELRPPIARRLRDRACATGIPVTTVALNALNDLGVMTTDSSVALRVDDLVQRAIDAAVTVSAPSILVPAFRASAIRRPADIAATASALLRIARLARAAKLTVVHENALGARALAKLQRAVLGSNIHFVFDVGNLDEHGVDWRGHLAQTGQDLHGEAHLKDRGTGPAGAVPLGAGATPLRHVVEALLDTGRVDCFVLETDLRGHEEEGIRAEVAALAGLIETRRGSE